ncbi:MAG: hypothetical protein ACR2OC_08425 [Solirubrobacterales bacterium]
MASVEQLLADFTAEFREAGEADPRKYLGQVEGADRRELAVLIDAAIERAPRRSWDPAGFKGSFAERAVEQLAVGLEPEGEPLTELLPKLRNERQLRRDEVVGRLTELLGLSGEQHEQKVARYYHQLEHGILPATDVSARVFDALGSIFDQSAARLRAAGRRMSLSDADGAASPAFARTARPGPPSEIADADADAMPAAAQSEDWDEVDELFRGGQ